MTAMDAFEFLSVRSRNRLLRKYQTIPNDIRDFDFYKNYLQYFNTVDFNMGPFEEEPELGKLLQQLVAGSYVHSYSIDIFQNKRELLVNLKTDDIDLRGPLSNLSRKELGQLTNHLLVEQFDKEAAQEEKKVSSTFLAKIRDMRLVHWETRILETSMLLHIFRQEDGISILKPEEPGFEDGFFGISGRQVPLAEKYPSSVHYLLHGLFLSLIDINMVAKALRHLSGIDDLQNIDDFVNQFLEEYVLLAELYQSVAYQLDKEKTVERLISWEKQFGPLDVDELFKYTDFFRLTDHELQLYQKVHEHQQLLTPERIKASLDQSVIGQEYAKQQISLLMYLHLLRCGQQSLPNGLWKVPAKKLLRDLPRPNMLLLGPTGSGKSFIIKTICEILQLPFITIDCASLTASGYVGSSIADHFRGLNNKYQDKPGSMVKAVIFFDEFDKISETKFKRDSVGGVELQQEFLMLLEGNEFQFEESKRSEKGTMVILRTDNILFVFSGTFHGIDEIISKRISSGYTTLGFRRSPDTGQGIPASEDLQQYITTEDLISYGMIPELAGRVNHLIPLRKLTREDYIRILKESDKSPLKSYHNFFTLHRHTLVITEAVYGLLADAANEGQTGARGLAPLVHKLMNALMWQAAHELDNDYTIDEAFYHEVMR